MSSGETPGLWLQIANHAICRIYCFSGFSGAAFPITCDIRTALALEMVEVNEHYHCTTGVSALWPQQVQMYNHCMIIACRDGITYCGQAN